MIKKIMITLICVFMLPIIVYADMGAPEITSYEVLVTNTNGAQAYDYYGNKLDKIFDFNENLTIIMEISIDGMIYLGVDYEDGDNNSYYINEQDVSIDGDVNFDKFYKKEGKLYVFDEGAVLYKGPSIKYGVIDDSNIPIGTTLTYEYSDELWAYVEYNGKKGWIYTYSFEGFSQYENLESSVCNVSESSYITLKDEIEIYEKPDLKSNKQKVSIPRNTIVTGDKTFVRYPKSSFEYIKVGDYEGWIYVEEDSDIFGYKAYNHENEITKFLTIDSINLTEFIDSTDVIIEIPKNSKIELKDYYVYENDSYDYDNSDTYYFIEYEDKNGWIKVDKLANYVNEKILTLNDVKLSNNYDGDDHNNYVLKKYDEIDGYYHYLIYSSDERYYGSYYIEKDDIKGWINLDKNNVFANSSWCKQYYVIVAGGVELTSLTNKKITVPYHTMLTELYSYNENNEKISIVEYEGEKYIFNSYKDVAKSNVLRYRFYIEEEENVELAVYIDEYSDDVLFRIPNGEEFDTLFEYTYDEFGNGRYLINYNGQKGWIKTKNADLKSVYVENFRKDKCLLTEDDLKQTFESKEEIKTVSKNSKVIVISCVIIAVALSISSTVGIILINKKIKQKLLNRKLSKK